MIASVRNRGTVSLIQRTIIAVVSSGLLATAMSGCGSLRGAAGDAGSPVVVMTWAPQGTKATNMPGMPAIAQAFAKDVNAHGGLAGHPLQVLTCNEGNDSIRAAACARQAVESGAVAVVGSYSQHGSGFMPLLEGAGIPYIGGYGVAPEEFTSPLSYPVNGGIPTLLAGNGRQLADYDCDRVSVVRPDTTSGDLVPDFLNAGLRAGGRGTSVDVKAPEDATDYTSSAERAVGGDLTGSCVTAVLGERTDTFFDSYRRLDPQRTKLASVLGSVRQSLVDSTGGASGPLEGVYATGWYPPENDPRWNKMRQVVRKQAFSDARIDTADPGEQTAWVAYTVFASVVRSLGDQDVTASSVKQALDHERGVDTGGLTPRLSWRLKDMISLRDYPRIVNTAVTYQVVRSGQLTALRRGFIDVGKMLERYAPS